MVKDQSSGFQENTNTVQTPLSIWAIGHAIPLHICPPEASSGLSSPLFIPLSHSLAVREGWAPAVGG